MGRTRPIELVEIWMTKDKCTSTDRAFNSSQGSSNFRANKIVIGTTDDGCAQAKSYVMLC